MQACFLIQFHFCMAKNNEHNCLRTEHAAREREKSIFMKQEIKI